jgi:hypothetical protein
MAGTPGVGYCKLVIESAKGETVRDDDELIVICRSGRPDTGNWVTIDKLGRYFVDRVEFFREPGKSKDFYYPTCYLRPAGARRTSPRDDSPDKPTLLPSPDTRKVIAVDFTAGAHAQRLHANILPANLIANIVTFAYRLQATNFDRDKRALEDELQSADPRLRKALVDVLDILSREAKANAVECHQFFGVQSAGAVPSTEPEGSPRRGRQVVLTLVKGDSPENWNVRAA